MLSQISTTTLCMEPHNPFTFWMALKRQSFLVESATLQRNKSGEYAKYKWTDGPSTDAIDVLLKLAPEDRFPRADDPKQIENRISVLITKLLDASFETFSCVNCPQIAKR